MKKDPLIFLKHIEESIERIERFMRGVDRQRMEKDELLQSALIRQIEVIGEAVKNLEIGFTVKYPYVEWSEIAGMRDKLIHNYFGIDLETIWKVIKKDIPELRKQIKQILSDLNKNRVK